MDRRHLQEVKRFIIGAVIANAFIILFSLIAFYYNTKATIQFQQIQMDKMEKKLDMLIEMHLTPTANVYQQQKF